MVKINKQVKIEKYLYNNQELRYRIRVVQSQKVILNGVNKHGYHSFQAAVKAYEYRYGKDALQGNKIINRWDK